MKKKRPSMNKRALLLFVIFGMLFFILSYRFFVIQITGQAEGKALAAYAEQIYEKERTLDAKRGSIFDRNGSELAVDTIGYRLVAVLSSSVTPKGAKEPKHVVDPQSTATQLAKYIDMDVNEIYSRLTKDAFQVEFGEAGKNLPYEVKEKIEKLKLPGITFIRESMRSYPNGIFASHLIGFANMVQSKKEKSEKLVGQLGIEKLFNDELTGIDGKMTFQSDIWGYILPNKESIIQSPKEGSSIYLTIDKKIQTFLEDSMNQVQEEYNPVKMMGIVANAKTGEILAMAQRPTFDPNTREGINDNWQNIVVENAFEPGSTMKVFTLAAAIEEGVFNPNDVYVSGSYPIPGSKPIRDHNWVGWGKISYLEGLQRSSNVGFAYLLEKIGTNKFKDYLDSFKFGVATGIGLPNESTGIIQYKYLRDKVSTSFGQASSVTALQLVQGMTAITNKGNMMKPYLIDKIVDSEGKIIKEIKPEKVSEPISEKTADEVLKYLETVVTGEYGTGKIFNIDSYRVAGKTGTAQIHDTVNGGYLEGYDNYIFSFLGAAPIDDPELIVYVMVQQPDLNEDEYESGAVPVSKIFNPVMKNSLQYLNIEPDETISSAEKVSLPDLNGKTTQEAKQMIKNLNLQSIVIGDGNKIVSTSPSKEAVLIENEIVMLKTDGDIKMPDLTGWSLANVMKLKALIDIPIEISGSGYVKNQSIKPNSTINKNSVLKIELESPLERFQSKVDQSKETDEDETS